MFYDWRAIFMIGCFLLSSRAEESRKSRSINNNMDRSLQFRRNTIQTQDRDYNQQFPSINYSIEPKYVDVRNNTPTTNISSIPVNENSEELDEEEERWYKIIMSKDYHVSSPTDLENFDRIGEKMIARANITEEAKRVVRQVKNQRPGFFWTLARVAFETVNETKSAIQQISTLVGDSISPETTTTQSGMGAALMSTTTQQVTTMGDDNSTESIMTTTEEPYKLTVSGLQRILRRNFRGLVRLFNIEWEDAINQSQINVREFQRDLGNKISPFLQDNPDVV